MSTAVATPTFAYQELLYTVLQRPRDSESGGLVVAVTSASSGEGVTYTVRMLAAELGDSAPGSVVRVDLEHLQQQNLPVAEIVSQARSAGSNRVSEFAPRGPLSKGGSERWRGSYEYRRGCIEQLRREFQYVLIDCPALRESSDVLSLASLVDGIILVVEAGTTKRDQVLNAERSITAAGGTMLGHILNKRRYPIPEWIYKRL